MENRSSLASQLAISAALVVFGVVSGDRIRPRHFQRGEIRGIATAGDAARGCEKGGNCGLLQTIRSQSEELLLFLFGSNNAVDRAALWTGAIAIVTALAAGFALFQLRSIRRTSRADFTKRFIDSFFVADSRLLFTLLLNSALEFAVRKIEVAGDEIDELPYLRIKTEITEQLTGIVSFDTEKTGYSAFEVDDFLLGHFEDVGWYVRRKLMDLHTAYQSLVTT
jgi:hypothetical protein